MASMLDDGNMENRGKVFNFAHPQFPHDAIKKPWCVALVGKKLFFYWKEECMPRFSFYKKNGMWRGHGLRVKSVRDLMDWVDKQPR